MHDETSFSQEHVILQDVWRKAHSMPNGWEVACKDEATATRMRFSLYNAVKHFRSGKYEADAALILAMKECSISFTPDKKGLIIRKKVLSGMLPSLVALLGGMPKSTQELVEEEHAREFAKRMSKEIAEDKPEISQKAHNYGARS